MGKIITALKVKEIRRRLLFVLFCLIIIRLGAQIPVPFIDSSAIKSFFNSNDTTNGAFNLVNAFTGGGLENFSILALSITPYITSSIIVQLLTIAFPSLEEMQRDGEEGRKKLLKITRWITIGLSVFESVAMGIGFRNQGLLVDVGLVDIIVIAASLSAGSMFLVWIGDEITVKGIGNGTSMVLLINIISRIPSNIQTLFENFVKGKTIAKMGLSIFIIAAIIVATVIFVVIEEGATRNIPINYSSKMVGRRSVGGQGSNIPLKVNTAGVIPVIFASSIMSFPGIILAIIGKSNIGGVWGTINNMLNQNNWFNFDKPIYNIGLGIYILLIIFFAYFYTTITFNPVEITDNLKKSGGMIPGIRPGKPTEEYLTNLLKYIIFIGAVGLLIVCIIPIFFNGIFNANVSFGGTSLIIIVGVIIETVSQIDSMMAVRTYKGFLD